MSKVPRVWQPVLITTRPPGGEVSLSLVPMELWASGSNSRACLAGLGLSLWQLGSFWEEGGGKSHAWKAQEPL